MLESPQQSAVADQIYDIEEFLSRIRAESLRLGDPPRKVHIGGSPTEWNCTIGDSYTGGYPFHVTCYVTGQSDTYLLACDIHMRLLDHSMDQTITSAYRKERERLGVEEE